MLWQVLLMWLWLLCGGVHLKQWPNPAGTSTFQGYVCSSLLVCSLHVGTAHTSKASEAVTAKRWRTQYCVIGQSSFNTDSLGG